MEIKIRYNTNYPERSDKKWRVIVCLEGSEIQHLVDEVEINCKSFTSEDVVKGDDGNLVTKYHISCKPKELIFSNKKIVKAILK